MGYIAEFWVTPKSGKNKGIPRLWKKLPVDNNNLKLGEVLTYITKKSERRLIVNRIEHVYYNEREEYFTRYHVRTF